MKKKLKQNKNFNINQNSFYFEDYLETNQNLKKNQKSTISDDRIYILFFFFLCLITIFSVKITLISFQKPNSAILKKTEKNFLPLRRDIIDRNGVLISRNINAFHAAVRPKLLKNKEKFLFNIKLNFPEITQSKLKNNLDKNKYFYLKKRLTKKEKNKLWSMGEKAIVFEPYQARIYPHSNLFSHVLGQIDDDNYGVSGVERYLDKELKDLKNINTPVELSLDSNIQFLIKTELTKAIEDFQAPGAASVLIDNKTGEVLSLVSLPDYNINLREDINNDKYINKITKGLFELGSVFKTFTVALALEEEIFQTETIIKNIPKKIKCSKYEISDIHEFPSSMSVQDILIQSSNIGAIKIARSIGEEKFKLFLEKLNLLNKVDFELDEIGIPHILKWNKCKLETVSYGHGIMTTPLQVASAYATISNGGFKVKPTLKRNHDHMSLEKKQIISEQTSKNINKILRKVVIDEKGTASLANIFGYDIGGKTGTAQDYQNKKQNINTFVSIFPAKQPRYILLVMLNDPKPAPHIVYNYRGQNIKVNRNEAGWNSVYVAGKIIKKIGPILAINNNEVYNNHVVKKYNQ